MSITLETKQLRAVAVETSKVAISGTAAAAAIFANVLIREGKDGRVTFAATDLDSALERELVAVSGDMMRTPLHSTVPARLLKDIAVKLPADAQVELTIKDGKMIVASGRSRFTLSTLPAEDFPVFPRLDWDAQFELPAADLADLIDRLSFAMGSDTTRYYLMGIYFHRFELDGVARLRAAATDGHRLARADIPLPEGAEDFPEAGVIVPRVALKTIRELIEHMRPEADGGQRMLDVAVSSARIEIDFGEGQIGSSRHTSKLLDGTYPTYDRVIPVGNPHTLTIDKAALRDGMERVATIISEKSRIVKCCLSKDLLVLDVRTAELGQAREEIPCDWFGPPMEIGFNAKYAAEVLASIDGDTVVVELRDAGAPTLWRDQAEVDSLFVLMPVRV